AKLARRRPALHNLHLRYYEDLTAHKQMQQAISYIEQHHTEPLTIQQVASHLNFSTSHFSRIFKREVGRSFVDYVAITRINKSLPYLRKHQYKLDIISTKVGFNTPNYFSMSFKKYVGFSPKVYRNTQEFLFI
ncbi:AraC family transcriptional regulator, partial [Streptococcus mutans]|nr:AraC family transcriptional regulator [Streptococcus mutans]